MSDQAKDDNSFKIKKGKPSKTKKSSPSKGSNPAQTKKAAAPTKKGVKVSEKDRGIILSVLRFCEEEAKMKGLKIPLAKAHRRTAVSTGVCVRTIQRIRTQAEKNPEEVPGSNRGKRQQEGDSEDPGTSKKLKYDKLEKNEVVEEKSASPSDYVFPWSRIVDLNCFVLGLRRAIKHHDKLGCGIGDMYLSERNGRETGDRVHFRCRVCLKRSVVFIQEPIKKGLPPTDLLKDIAVNPLFICQLRNDLPKVKDTISPKMRNLPEFPESYPFPKATPLIGWPKVSTISKPSQPLVQRPTIKATTIAELTFEIDQPERVQFNRQEILSTSLPPTTTISTSRSSSSSDVGQPTKTISTSRSSSSSDVGQPTKTISTSRSSSSSDVGQPTKTISTSRSSSSSDVALITRFVTITSQQLSFMSL